jgi:hypothetical protein
MDETQHQVTISKPFYMGVHHLTQLQWTTLMGTTVAQQMAKGTMSWGNTPNGVGDNYPMYFINWDEATAFCQAAASSTSQTVRLPTESDWEYAAQAGSGEMLFWGKNVPSVIGQYAWGSWNTGGQTQLEGQLKPNPFGLFDVEGNVWGWCSDWYSNYPAGPVTDPTGPAGPGTGQYENYRICRGGCYTSGWGGMRSSDRWGSEPSGANRVNAIGFRVTMGVPPADSTSPVPAMVTAPANRTVAVGLSATFSVVAAGGAPLSYQWLRNGASIAGATSATYTMSRTYVNDNGATFAVAISNAAGRIVSGNALLTIDNIPPVITVQPANASVSAGAAATFSVTATSNVLPLSYRWTRNGASIANATSATYTIPPAASGDNGTIFAAVVSNSRGDTASHGAVLTVGTIRHIGFQPSTSILPLGYQRDDGSVYNASRGWGWDVALGARDRGPVNADPRLNTYVFSSAVATWRCDLPNGRYTVNIVCGDAGAISGPQWVYVQGAVAIQVGGWEGGAGALIPTPINYFETATNFSTTVTNGQLNVMIGDGTHTTTINYIDIVPAPSDVEPATTRSASWTVTAGQAAVLNLAATGTTAELRRESR